MFANTYFLRVLFVYLLLLLVGLNTLAWFSIKQIETSQHNNYLKSLDNAALLLTETIEHALINQHNPKQSLQSLLDKVSLDRGQRILLLKVDGSPWLSNYSLKNNNNNYLELTEFEQAYKNGVGSDVRYSPMLDQNMFYVVRTIKFEGAVYAYVRVEETYLHFLNALKPLRELVYKLGFLALLISVLFGFYVWMRIFNEVRYISHQLNSISRGNYNQNLSTNYPEVLSRLVQSINRIRTSQLERVQEIAREKNQLMVTLASMSEGVIALDQEQKIIHINQAARELLGLNEARIEGRMLWEYIRHPQINSIIEQAFERKEGSKGQMHLNTERGEIIADLHATSFAGSSEERHGVVLVIQDNTQQHRVQNMRRDFVANASHELKTPVTAIRALIETIRDDDDMPDKIRKQFIEKIFNQIERTTDLLKQLMDLSSVEETVKSSKVEEFNLTALCREVIKYFDDVLGELDLNFSSADSVQLSADRKEISQVVSNLIENAIKYTEQGEINVSVHEDDDAVYFSVQDTGIGISPIEQERIFERFYRVDKAHSREIEGSGLGLSIVKNIVEKYNGSLTVDSKKSQGSTFTAKFRKNG